MNKQEVLQLIGLTKARYQSKFQHNTEMEEMWCMILDDVPIDAAKPILAMWMKTEEWPPDPAHIRNAVLSQLSGSPTPDEAWQMVQQRIRDTYPGVVAPDWDAPDVVRQTVQDVGGIRAIRMSEKPEQTRDRFHRAYEQRAASTVKATEERLAGHIRKELT